MIGGLIFAGRFGFAAVSGTDVFAEFAGKHVAKLLISAKGVDREAGQKMVDAMRADAPVLSGNLVNGITVETEETSAGQITTVRASAVNEAGRGWDYAAFVEHGTENMEAEPFFYTDAERVMEERGRSAEELLRV